MVVCSWAEKVLTQHILGALASLSLLSRVLIRLFCGVLASDVCVCVAVKSLLPMRRAALTYERTCVAK